MAFAYKTMAAANFYCLEDYLLAEQQAKTSLRIMEKHLPAGISLSMLIISRNARIFKEHFDLAGARRIVGFLASEGGEELLLSALNITKASLGENNARTAMLYHVLGCYYFDQVKEERKILT